MVAYLSTNKDHKYSYVSIKRISSQFHSLMRHSIITYAAVAAKGSARRALVSSFTLPANRIVKIAIRPKRQSGERTLYNMTIAPISRRAAKKVLNHATKEPMARSDAYAMPFLNRLRSCVPSHQRLLTFLSTTHNLHLPERRSPNARGQNWSIYPRFPSLAMQPNRRYRHTT